MEFNEILKYFLLEIDKNPNEDVNEVLKRAASNLRESGRELSAKAISKIEKSFDDIDNITQKMKDLEVAKEEGLSRTDWFLEKLNQSLSRIPNLTDEQKSRILSSIDLSIKDTLKKQ